MTDTRAYVLAVLAAAAMMMASGCSGSAASPDAAPAVPGAAQPQTAPRAFDPPADFGPPTIEMSRDPAPGAAPVVEVLDDMHGWRIGSQGLVRVDLTTGVVTPGVFPDNPLDTSVDLDKIDNGAWSQDPAGDPIVADTPAGRLALAAFPITVPGRSRTTSTTGSASTTSVRSRSARAGRGRSRSCSGSTRPGTNYGGS